MAFLFPFPEKVESHKRKRGGQGQDADKGHTAIIVHAN